MIVHDTCQRVSALWPGGKLPLPVELSIRSFLANGMDVQLFIYYPCPNVPEGTTVRDASEVIPKDLRFTHETAGSTPFTDWFRNTLLEREGGFWTELDIVCLTPCRGRTETLPWFSEKEPGVFGTGFMGFSAGHPLIGRLRKLSEDPATVMPWDDPREAALKKQLLTDCPDVEQRRRLAPACSYGTSVFTKAVLHDDPEPCFMPSNTVYPVSESVWRYCYNGWLALQSDELRDARFICLWGNLLDKEPDALENVEKKSIVGELIDLYMPEDSACSREKKKVSILVGICSCCSATERRKAVRDTWMSHHVEGIECLFFVGRRTPLEDEFMDTVSLWVSDSYAHLPEKGLAFLRYALEHYDFEWLFKCDDDSYVALDRLPDLTHGQGDLIGDSSLGTRGAPSGGAGYFLSRELVEKIVASGNISPTGPEDIIFGNLAQQLGAVPESTERLCMHSGRYPLPDNDQVSSHWCKPRQLYALEQFYYHRPLVVYKTSHLSWEDEIEVYAGGYFRRVKSGCSGLLTHKGNSIFSLDWFHWDEELVVRSSRNHYTGEKLVLSASSGARDLAAFVAPGLLCLDADMPDLRIQMGCGERLLEGWVNLDLPDYDIKRPVPLPDSCVGAYYLEHVLEHVPFRECFFFFLEAWRTLKPGGVMRLAVTDVAGMVGHAEMFSPALDDSLYSGDPLPGRLLKYAEEHLGWKSFWSGEFLKNILEGAGFAVSIHEPGKSQYSWMCGLEASQSVFASSLPPIGTVCLEAEKTEKNN